LKAELYMNAKYDGTRWECRPLEPCREEAEDNQRMAKVLNLTLNDEAVKEFRKRRPFTLCFFNSNPSVYGFPPAKIKVNGIEYSSLDLINLTDDCETTVVELKVDGTVEKAVEEKDGGFKPL